MSESLISTTVHVCNCGPACKCGYSSASPSSCGCGVPTVERVILAEDGHHFYVSETGKSGEAFDVIGVKPFTSPDGKPLQAFPKEKLITSTADRTGMLKTRAENGIGNLSGRLNPNYRASDLTSNGHDMHGSSSTRKTVHKGHEIVIKTHYDITIDGVPFRNHVMVDNQGRVHSHGLPNYAYTSMLDLIKRLIDADQDRPQLTSEEQQPQGGHH